jgi:hypothetical protein
MSTAEVLCAGLPALFDAASARLARMRLIGLGVVCAEPGDRALFVYLDAFGSTGYLTRADDLPVAFRSCSTGRREIDAAACFSSHPGGLVESRLTQAQLPDRFERPARIERIVTLPIDTADPPAILAASLASRMRSA